jgi:hypothetical protein
MRTKRIVSAPRLTDRTIERAVRVLDTWSGKLTWDRYLDELCRVLGHRYTKVAMLNRQRIADAWRLAKQRRPALQIRAEDSALARSQERVDALKNENERLSCENESLKVQFLRWQYNAYQLKGLTIDQLDASLPPVDRGVTRGRPSKSRAWPVAAKKI